MSDTPGEPTMALYRPVGQKELDLIAASGYRAFPPRLPHQPIFCPVLDQSCAVQIARRELKRCRLRLCALLQRPH